MFDTKLQNFLDRHGACADGISRLQSLGIETLEQAWNQASDEDLIWAVTRPGVKSSEQRRTFLVMVLASIEDKLTDVRSLNILKKLRTKETITSEDRDAAWAAEAAARAAESAAWAACAARAAAWAAAWAAECAARAAAWAAEAAASAAEAAACAARAAAWAACAARAAACAAESAAEEAAEEAEAEAKAAQAKWVRENFKLCDLHTK